MVEKFLEKVEELKPELLCSIVVPKALVKIEKTGTHYTVENIGTANELPQVFMGKGDRVCLDFGEHCVGYISFDAETVGNPPDNPAHIRMKFGETPCEIAEPFEQYEGNISSSWLQEEFFFIDVLPDKVKMPRRYAFRYVEIEVLDTSHQYRLVIKNIACQTVTSGNLNAVPEVICSDPELKKIDKIGINTLKGCMQEVFEDGPKRDRRLWIGDLRLQALTNYVTFKNYDLVKRCLYLFAAVPLESGKTGSCLYVRPKVIVDTALHLFDYSLFFVSCLYDYYMETGDKETLGDLWETAYNQILLASQSLDENDVVKDHQEDWWWCFVDWNPELNKQAAAQAIFIFVLRQIKELAEILDRKEAEDIEKLIRRCSSAAIRFLWDEEEGFFRSGEEGQISWASQIWFTIAKVFPEDRNREILIKMRNVNPPVRLNTPYMNHCYVEALLMTGMKEEAKEHIKWYWGGMMREGADCFWEVYNPENPELSAYGDRIINSYCHAWSCTPSYFIRKYFSD